MPQIPPITVSIVSHRQFGLIQQLLRDLDRHCYRHISEVILTHNLPESATLDGSSLRFPVKIITNPQPLGFGENHNRAFTHCSSAWFLILNPDVRMDGDVVFSLLERAQPQTGLLAPQEIGPGGHIQDGPRGAITPIELLHRRLFKRSPSPPSRHGWVKGMFMLVRAQAWRQVSGFDSRYFLYCEDFDLCARLMLAHWTVDHHADIHVQHEWQRSSSKSWALLLLHLRSLARMWSSSTFWRYRALLKSTA